ncbi:TPA: hypothetical protein ACK3JJ_001467 [Mannheimia haemolytica]
MKLYHGTTTENFQKIINDGLKINMPSNYDGDVKTSKGFLYFSNNIALAAYYGHLVSYKKDHTQYVILEVDIPNEWLSIDKDELTMTLEDFGIEVNVSSVEECLDICGSVRISKDLSIDNLKRALFLDVNKIFSQEDRHKENTRDVTQRFIGDLRKYSYRNINENKRNKEEAENISLDLKWVVICGYSTQ